MRVHSDIKGYYRRLGLAPGASLEQIKRSYRSLAKDLHPDRHPDDPTATARFQALNEAYAVLSDPQTRAGYDAACIGGETSSTPRQPIEPVTCSWCGAVSAQPRYIVFPYVISMIFVTWRRAMHGIFCPSCAPKKALQASAVAWLLGWWGFPWGPIFTIGALYRNLLGGKRPADANAQILGRQALHFWQQGNTSLALAAVDQGLRLGPSTTFRDQLSELKRALPSTPRAELIDRWKLLASWGFWAQLAPTLAVVALVIWSNWK
jgi:DnaJ-domain-containing protein 1